MAGEEKWQEKQKSEEKWEQCEEILANWNGQSKHRNLYP